MDRMACVNAPALPLQILMRRHPDWLNAPAAVVDRDNPQGVIQWVNRAARACRILPGMRYAAGLSLSKDLRADIIGQDAVDGTITQIVDVLWCFSPRVEPSAGEPGIFWLDASGMARLFPTLDVWAARIDHALKEANFHAVVTVGFTRFGAYAAAKAGRKHIVFQSDEEEQAHLRTLAIERLDLDMGLRQTLQKLGVETLGAFSALAPDAVRRRLGAEAQTLHDLVRGEGWTALQPRAVVEPAEQRILLDYPESNSARLMDLIGALLRPVVAELAKRHEALTAVTIEATLDNGAAITECLSPAAPTLDTKQVLQLLRLRVEALTLAEGVVELTVRGEGVRANPGQLDLFYETPRRSLAAVERAFAAIRAELGNDAVQIAEPGEGHLPEAQYGWKRLESLAPARPREVTLRPLIRRIYSPAIPLPPRARNEPDGWLIAGIADGPVDEVIGPHHVSGGWWRREVSRAYHYVRTRKGRWLWIYHDLNRRRWFLQGEVE